jgi:homoisocitrate dehydrogenase
MAHRITLINGDGIGGEVIPAARQVLSALNLPLEFQEAEAGFGTFEKIGNALPPETLAACENSDAVLFGATQSPMGKVAGYASPILSLRKHFDLFANLRPAIAGNIDMFVVRENTEGLYSRRERVEDDGQTAITERVITAKASRRIVRLACEIAMSRPRKKLTIVHKANVLKETCGLFRTSAFEVTKDFPDLQVDEVLVDAAAMFMVQDPTRFDVIVTTNLFGDILSDLAAGLTGGLGIAPSANVGEGKPGIFEPVHGSAPDIVGKGIADPRAAILSGALALETLGYMDEAAELKQIVYGTPHTGSTMETVKAILSQI